MRGGLDGETAESRPAPEGACDAAGSWGRLVYGQSRRFSRGLGCFHALPGSLGGGRAASLVLVFGPAQSRA